MAPLGSGVLHARFLVREAIQPTFGGRTGEVSANVTSKVTIILRVGYLMTRHRPQTFVFVADSPMGLAATDELAQQSTAGKARTSTAAGSESMRNFTL
jgi:hypothetical protein